MFIGPFLRRALIAGLGLFAAVALGCGVHEVDMYSGPGKMPIYLPKSELNTIMNQLPRPIGQTGTIFLTDSFFCVLEPKKGIHVYHLRDSLPADALTFWSIPAITDFVIEGGFLYADSWKDLVTVDISDPLRITEVGRATDVFSPILYPPLYNGHFECVDERKGAVVGWVDTTLSDVLCRTIN